MPIKSYILHNEESKKNLLVNALRNIPNCEVIPSENQEVIILVTDTETEELDKELYNRIVGLQGLKHLSLVSGFDDK